MLYDLEPNDVYFVLVLPSEEWIVLFAVIGHPYRYSLSALNRYGNFCAAVLVKYPACKFLNAALNLPDSFGGRPRVSAATSTAWFAASRLSLPASRQNSAS